jgi:hypothetical protein
MPVKTDWPCWEIMQCTPENALQCPAYKSNRPCWEIMREIDPFSAHICSDCIVYVIKQKESIFSKEEIIQIMHRKGIHVDSGCPLQHAKVQHLTQNN